MSALVETMAYNRAQTPWHGLGKPVDANLSPAQMQKEAELDWNVVHAPSFYEFRGEKIYSGWDALVRSSDGRHLTTVPSDWKEVQNSEAFEFFRDFCEAGNMSMETAGSLKQGQVVWVLARMNDGFELPGNDRVMPYMLFTNPFKYGLSTSVSWTGIRVVCNNTLKLSLSSTSSDKIVKVSHRRDFVAEQVREVLGLSQDRLAKYKEMAEFLAAKPARGEDIVTYFKRIFPVLTSKSDSKKDMSLPAKKCLEVLDSQPGAEMSAGTWWQPYNAVTFYTDHVHGKDSSVRLNSAWYGENAKRKVQALKIACEMAGA